MRTNLFVALQQIKDLADECLREIGEQGNGRAAVKKSMQPKVHRSQPVDFGKPLRPFMKSYAKDLSGPKKFTLLLSWLAKGDLDKEVSSSEIQDQWGRMTSLLQSEYNGFFASQAKNNDWVDSKKNGRYNLRPDWRNVLKSHG
jgi:hypothetical protein